MKVSTNGPMRVNRKAPIYQYKKSKVLSIDMNSKRADVTSTGSCMDIPSLTLIKREDTMHENKKATKAWTEISFPEYKGWTIIMAEVSRYTLSVALVK